MADEAPATPVPSLIRQVKAALRGAPTRDLDATFAEIRTAADAAAEVRAADAKRATEAAKQLEAEQAAAEEESEPEQPELPTEKKPKGGRNRAITSEGEGPEDG